MATIKPIDGRSVHQIQSGQVIVDLQSVCKELVENSIDAGATVIEVRFKNSGLDAVEVQDNGAGIAPDDYNTIALKHYTSKLATYDDLSSLQTFGFRGEALSSLCALSNFHIVTARASDGPKGTKLDFEQSGKLKDTSIVAAKQGTTVVVETLFHNLPVRRKELEKNIKREYNKVLQLLNAYACISVGVKFSVSNQASKGKKTIAFATNSNANTRDNISNVYGAKTVTALIPLDLEFDMDPSNRPDAPQSAKNWSTQEDIGSRKVRIEGHVSRPVVGEGRQTPDRQMFFVNSRPCNLPQMAKAFNEVYKSFNMTQSPFIFADIRLDTNAYDVNVSPDKRTIMLHDQTALLEQLKVALLDLFYGHDQSVPQAQSTGKKLTMSSFRPPTMHARDSTTSVPAEDLDEETDEVLVSGRPSARREVESHIESSSEGTKPGFIKASLIERFAGRNTEDRLSHSAVSRAPRLPHRDTIMANQNDDSPNTRQRRATTPNDRVDDVTRPRSQSPLFETEGDANAGVQRSQPSRIVQDFNARIASQQARQGEERIAHSPPRGEAAEQPIPSLKQTPRRGLSQSTIQNAFDRMRPMQTPVQQATITVGDTTTISTIGTRSAALSRRARIHTPKFSLSGKPLEQTPKKSLFRKGLYSFAAPGTQPGSSDEEEIDEDYLARHGNQIALQRDLRSLSPPKRLPPQCFEEPRTDDLMDSSSAPLPYPVWELPEVGEENSTAQAHVDDVVMSDSSDAEYIDEAEKKAREEEMITQMIAEVEGVAARPTALNLKRASKLFKLTSKKYWTINIEKVVEVDVETIAQHMRSLQNALHASDADAHDKLHVPQPSNQEDAEEHLSLTVSKPDFHEMRIIGQFNLGFIIAVRPPSLTSRNSELFIIDQHASDEKYNFERLSGSTTLISQRLVRPHPLELTAVEEEIILANRHVLTANGFVVDLGTGEEEQGTIGRRARLTSLPMSKEVTFTPKDLEELLALMLDDPTMSSHPTTSHIPRPSKVRKLLASRACRSSVMIGKTLQHARMTEIVRHMGSMDKPWACPHGRPTMRHLYGLNNWQGWTEGDGVIGVDVPGKKADWAAYLRNSGH